ncbi:hypothetical protein FRC02_005344, partial [Tulasnella sp. 418]
MIASHFSREKKHHDISRPILRFVYPALRVTRPLSNTPRLYNDPLATYFTPRIMRRS